MNYDFRSVIPSRLDAFTALQIGEQAQLVRRFESQADTYLFKHALVQEAAYSLLTRHERKRLHRLTAVVLESGATIQPDELNTELAWHYTEAGEAAKASEYHIRAGDAAVRTFASTEARLHYKAALKLLATLGDAAQVVRAQIDTTNKYASTAFRVDAPSGLFALLKESESAGETLPQPLATADRARLAYLRRWLGLAASLQNDFATFLAYMIPLMQEAQELGLDGLFAQVSGELGVGEAGLGNFGKALPLLEASLPILERDQDWKQWLHVARHLALTLCGIGKIDKAKALAETCTRHGREMGDRSMTAAGYATFGFIYWMTGEGASLLEVVQKSGELETPSGETVSMIIGYALQALAHSRMGDQERARASIMQEERAAQQFGGEQFFQMMVLPIRTEIAFNLGDYADAVGKAQQTLAFAQPMSGLWATGVAERVWAQSLAAIDPLRETEIDAHFAASLKAFESGQAVLEAARTHVAWGNVLTQRGAKDAAREHFVQALAQYEKSGLAMQLEETQAQLSKVN